MLPPASGEALIQMCMLADHLKVEWRKRKKGINMPNSSLASMGIKKEKAPCTLQLPTSLLVLEFRAIWCSELVDAGDALLGALLTGAIVRQRYASDVQLATTLASATTGG